MSSRPARRAAAGSTSRAASATAMPIGTLMKSTQRQESHSVMNPPSTRPSELPPVTTAE
jgi:hypothetical protein